MESYCKFSIKAWVNFPAANLFQSASEDCSFGSKEFWGHSSVSIARKYFGKGAWWNATDFAGNAGKFSHIDWFCQQVYINISDTSNHKPFQTNREIKKQIKGGHKVVSTNNYVIVALL